jgi:dihydropteroate synthase
MGILNLTPDSFSDGGKYLDPAKALDQAEKLVAEGADIIDIGGESTRPSAVPVDEETEMARVLPVVEKLSKSLQVPISIDTYKSGVAQRGLDLGAQIVNDISGLTFDDRMIQVCANSRAGVICMHIQGTPLTMQVNPSYANVVADVRSHLHRRSEALMERGIRREAIVLDPGIGFGKTADHNLDLLSNLHAFRELGFPVLIGHSRKRFLGKIVHRTVGETGSVDAGFATVGVSLALAQQGIEILRLHEIAPTRDALCAWRAIQNRRGRD